MDIEVLRDAQPRTHLVFVDTSDHRLVVDDPVTIDGVTYTDTWSERPNRINNFTVVFREPFRNVVSVEILTADFPCVPLRTYNTESNVPLRYFSIRSDTIEQHLARTKYRIDYDLGLAKIAWESLENKVFHHYKREFFPRYFHPIGRLHSIDFKTFRHNTDTPIKWGGSHFSFLLEVVVLEPVMPRKETFTGPFDLNRHYDPRHLPGLGDPVSSDDEDLADIV